MRVGILGTRVPAKTAVARAGKIPGALVNLFDVATAPAAVDVLFIAAPLDQAADLVTGAGSVANAVVVLDRPLSAWPIVDARLALLRAATSASSVALARLETHEALPKIIGTLLFNLTHAVPFDTALTTAFGRDVLITGEVDVLDDLTLPNLTRRLADDLSLTASRMRDPSVARPVTQASTELRNMSQGLFLGERHEASNIGPAVVRADVAIDEASEPRWLQCSVESLAKMPNAFLPGTNTVDVFIGPAEEGALAAGQLSNEDLGLDPGIESVRVTVVLVPLVPRADPLRAELEIPRLGRSPSVRFALDVPSDATEVAARLLVLHRNRVLQTAVLAGPIGETAKLTEVVAMRRDLSRLDDQRTFDLAVFANHDNQNVRALIAHSNDYTYVDGGDEIDGITRQLREHLGKAAFLKPAQQSAEQKQRELLITIAVHGRDLLNQLEARLAPFASAQRIQIVTARAEWFLPLELAYSRHAPDPDAAMCPSWLDGGSACGPDCGGGPENTSIVCPAAFWGMGKTIERVYYTPSPDEVGNRFLVLAEPSPSNFRLTVGHAVVGASSKVRNADVLKTLRLLDVGAVQAKDWGKWITALQSVPADLLMLMPHTNVSTLEISRSTLERGRIESRYVTGGHQINPLVVLFGCDTAGSQENPAGYATRFLQRQAGLVLTSLTVLLNTHAVQLAQRLAQLLRDPDRPPQPVGELMTTLRRTAVRDGLLAALALTAYGNMDWTV